MKSLALIAEENQDIAYSYACRTKKLEGALWDIWELARNKKSYEEILTIVLPFIAPHTTDELCNYCGWPLSYRGKTTRTGMGRPTRTKRCMRCDSEIHRVTPEAEAGHPFPHNHPS